MEVVVKMEGTKAEMTGEASTSSTSPETETLMLGRFTMVCRDSKTQKARKVPRLIVETEEERVLWDLGEGAARLQTRRLPADSTSSYEKTERDVYARSGQGPGRSPGLRHSLAPEGTD